MTREIKFRAWNGAYISEPFDPRNDEDHPSGEEIIWLQYTGLKDKNGKEIYAGYIVFGKSSCCDTPSKEEVRWHEYYAGFTPFCIYDSDCGDYFEAKECEIIGDIYNNPELLDNK